MKRKTDVEKYWLTLKGFIFVTSKYTMIYSIIERKMHIFSAFSSEDKFQSVTWNFSFRKRIPGRKKIDFLAAIHVVKEATATFDIVSVTINTKKEWKKKVTYDALYNSSQVASF